MDYDDISEAPRALTNLEILESTKAAARQQIGGGAIRACIGSGGGTGGYIGAAEQERQSGLSDEEIRFRADVLEPFFQTGFPMKQIMEWVFIALPIAKAMNPPARRIFLNALRVRFSKPEGCCDASIQEAKEAADFIISGQTAR